MRNGGSHPEIQIGLPVFPIGNTKYSTDRNTDPTSSVPNSKHSLGGVQGRNTNTLQTEIQNRTRTTHWEVFTLSEIQIKIQNTVYTDKNTDPTSNVPNTKHSLGGGQYRNTEIQKYKYSTEIQNTVQTEIQNQIRNTHWEVFTLSGIVEAPAGGEGNTRMQPFA